MRRARIAGAWHPWGVTLLVVAIALLAAGIPGASSGLQYDRSLIGQGQWWRLVTSHWVHWTPDHLTWDLLAFAALTAAAIRLSRGRALATVALASCLIPVCIWVFNPELVRYRGLSGLASALYVLVVLEVWGRIPRGESRGKGVVAWLLLVGFAAKVVYELVSGERRVRAAILAEMATIPALVRDVGDDEMLKLGLIENIQRQDLNPIETAEAYKALLQEFDWTHEELFRGGGEGFLAGLADGSDS